MTQEPWTKFVGVGLQLASGVLLGFFVGYWADNRWGTSPWLLLGGTFLGAAAGFYALFKEFGQQKK